MSLINKCSRCWDKFLNDDIICCLDQIETAIGENYTPPKDKIMKFLSNDLEKIKVCIIGQDVYYQPDTATGRAFEVNGLNSWFLPFRNSSLKNILRLIHKSYRGIKDYKDIKKFTEILREIKTGCFSILPPDKLFDSLEDQGVLFLNASLTTEIGKPNAHKSFWTEFSIKLFSFISSEKPDIKWFLWGDEAIKTKDWIKSGIIYTSRHPMLCSEKYHNDFLKSGCISDTMEIINWTGINPLLQGK